MKNNTKKFFKSVPLYVFVVVIIYELLKLYFHIWGFQEGYLLFDGPGYVDRATHEFTEYEAAMIFTYGIPRLLLFLASLTIAVKLLLEVVSRKSSIKYLFIPVYYLIVLPILTFLILNKFDQQGNLFDMSKQQIEGVGIGEMTQHATYAFLNIIIIIIVGLLAWQSAKKETRRLATSSTK